MPKRRPLFRTSNHDRAIARYMAKHKQPPPGMAVEPSPFGLKLVYTR